MHSNRKPSSAFLALLGIIALNFTATPARAQDSVGVLDDFLRPRRPTADLFHLGDGLRLVDTDADSASDDDDDEELPQHPVPHYRLELTFRFTFLIDSKLKIGPADTAHTMRPRRDLHLPGTPSYGLRGLFEVKFHESFLIGGYYTHVFVRGPEREIHYTGVSLGGDRIPGGARVQTSLDISMAEVFLRYVGRDDAKVKFSFGIGLAWTAFRLRLAAESLDADGRVDGYFAPTIGYMIQFEALPWLHLFLESMNALIAPTRFPSYASEFRLGVRIPLGNVELMIAASSFSGQIEDLKDLTGGKANTSTHRWRQASWWVAGGEFGFAWRF